MIISANSEPNRKEFNTLLDCTIKELKSQAKKSKSFCSKYEGRKLEPHVKDVMTALAVGTAFEKSIELISGQKFPDIVAKKYYGIEVKTTRQNHWKTTGNSVLEGTRVEDVERIFILFAKLANPVEFRYRPYEECLSEVVVTHSPRYLIDMNIEKGKTIFDKIEVPYEILRKKENPIRPIVDYYKSKLEAGEDLWWIDQENSNASNLVIKNWTNLSAKEKKVVRNKAMVYFPELFSNGSHKFARLAIWLVTREGVVCHNIRDLFTAGGRGKISVGKKTYKNVPRIVLNLINNLDFIIETIGQTSSVELSDYWGKATSEKRKIDDWIELISQQSKKISDAKHLNLKEILTEKIRNEISPSQPYASSSSTKKGKTEAYK